MFICDRRMSVWVMGNLYTNTVYLGILFVKDRNKIEDMQLWGYIHGYPLINI